MSASILIAFGSLLCAALGLTGASLWRLGSNTTRQQVLTDTILVDIRQVRADLAANMVDIRAAFRECDSRLIELDKRLSNVEDKDKLLRRVVEQYAQLDRRLAYIENECHHHHGHSLRLRREDAEAEDQDTGGIPRTGGSEP